MRKGIWVLLVVVAAVAMAGPVWAETYEVSDLETLDRLVQFEAEPGDVIELQPGTYYFETDRIRVARSGTPEAPIVIRGVAEDGKRPVIDAERVNVKRCIFNVRPGVHDVIFENLEMRNAWGSRFEDRQTYGVNASAIYFENCNNITVRNCESHHNEDGFFATHGADCILIENCDIHHNGTLTTKEHNRTHNFYFCAKRQMVKNCYIHDSLEGENFKSRADNTIFAFNWVDEEAIYSVAVDSGGGRNTLWLGNVVMKRSVLGHGQGRLLGVGDGTGVASGVLVALNNTFVTVFPRDFYLFTVDSSTTDVVLLNNVFAGPGEVFLEHNGKGKVTGRNNWIQKGIKDVPEGLEGTVFGDHAGFADMKGVDFRPKEGSALIDAGISREEALAAVRLVTGEAKSAAGEVKPSPIWLKAVDEIESSVAACEPVVKGYGLRTRADDGKTDIGAYEYVKMPE